MNENLVDSKSQKSTRKRQSNYFMVKLIGGWMLVLLIIVGGSRLLYQDESQTRKPPASKTSAELLTSEEDTALLSKAGQTYQQTFLSFLAAGTPEERNQFVLNPISAASRIARFYSLNPQINIDPATLRLSKASVVRLPGGRAIETYWTSNDGHLLDAVFVEENGDWKLDWDHYARYGDQPWPLFLAGSGEERGEFRLLARERLAEERKNKDSISVVFYAPRFGYSNSAGFVSPEFLVKRDTRNGRLLDAAFKLNKSGKRVFNADPPSIDPEGLIRVRVKIRRIEGDSERRFDLENVSACHWYSADVPGVEIPDQPPTN